MQHARPLTAEEKVQVLPEGPSGRIPTGRGSGLRAYPVAVRIRPTGPSPRGANGRRTTLRPWGSRFESGRGDHPGVAERFTRSAQTRLNAAALRTAYMWVRIPPPGPSWGGHSRRGRRRVVSAGVRVRVPLSWPGWARRSMAGSLVCTQEMRVRLPPGAPNEAVVWRLRNWLLKPEVRVLTPIGLTTARSTLGVERAHNPRSDGVRIPSARP